MYWRQLNRRCITLSVILLNRMWWYTIQYCRLHTWDFTHRSSEVDFITAALLETVTGEGRRQNTQWHQQQLKVYGMGTAADWQRLPLGHMDTCGMVQQHTTCKWLFIVFFFHDASTNSLFSVAFNTSVTDRRLLKTFSAVVVHLSGEQSLMSGSRSSLYLVCVVELQGDTHRALKKWANFKLF